MRVIAAAVGVLLAAAVASAQPNCVTVYLPDLAPAEGTQTADIRTGFPVPPAWTQPDGAFYPVDLSSNRQGDVYIKQFVGEPWAAERWFSGITSISLVYWSSVISPAYLGNIVIQPYKTLRYTAPAGVVPTWAYRRLQFFDGLRDNSNLSTPVQLGEGWNFSVWNGMGYMVWLDAAQAEARLCR